MGLQIWLPLNGNLENKGLLNSTIQSNNITVDNSGKLSTCYNFNGTDSFISLTNIYNIFKGDNNPFSITMWIYSSDSNDRSVLFGDYGLNGSSNTNLEKQTDGKIRFYWGNGVPDLIFNSILNNNEWVHLGLTYNGQKICLYINGQLSDSKQVTLSSLNKTSGLFYIGRDARTGTTALNGKINDFRLYDECLSPMQIKLISQGLVAHYLLNNNGSGNNNLVIGSNTDSLNTNAWRYSMQTGGNTKSIELDETNTYCVKIERDNTTHSGWSFLGYDNFLRDKIKTNMPYVLTFDCNASVSGSITFSNLMNSDATNGMVLVSSIQQIQKDVIANQWNHMVYKFITKDSFDDIQIQNQIIYLSVSTSLKDTGVVLKFKNIKLEYGDKPTPWCPNSEDALATQLGYNNNIEYDVSGYCYNGTKYNITDYTSDTPRYSVATKFNGTNSYINVGRGGMVKDEITINLWGYMDDWTKFNSRLISCTENGGWNFEASSGKIHFAVGTGFTSTTYKNTSGYVLSELSSGWHMFTGTYDGLVVKQYVDGVFNSSNNAYTTKTPIHYHSNNSILIGAEATGSATSVGGYYFNGNISNVRIYATALSESDIQSLYNNSAFVDSSGNIYSTEYIEE